MYRITLILCLFFIWEISLLIWCKLIKLLIIFIFEGRKDRTVSQSKLILIWKLCVRSWDKELIQYLTNFRIASLPQSSAEYAFQYSSEIEQTKLATPNFSYFLVMMIWAEIRYNFKGKKLLSTVNKMLLLIKSNWTLCKLNSVWS